MCGAEEPAEEETYDVIAKSLSHPIRRRILRLLDEKGQMHFSDLRDAVGIDKANLAYHLVQLSEVVKKTDQGYYVLSRLGDISISLIKNVEKSGERLSDAKDERYSKLLDEYERMSRSLPLSLSGDYSKAAKDELEKEIERTEHHFELTREGAIQRIYSDFFEPTARRNVRGFWTIESFKVNRWGTIWYLSGLAITAYFGITGGDLEILCYLGLFLGFGVAWLMGFLMDEYEVRNRIILFVGISSLLVSITMRFISSYSFEFSTYGVGMNSVILAVVLQSPYIMFASQVALGLLRAYKQKS